MTRHFIALLALFTGLAALNGPAHASMAGSSACDVRVSAEADAEARSEASVREKRAAKRPARKSNSPKPVTKKARLPIKLPVLMGVDRAYE